MKTSKRIHQKVIQKQKHDERNKKIEKLFFGIIEVPVLESDGTEHKSQAEFKFHQDGEHPIHPTSHCTKGQLFSLVIAFFLRHRITKTALQDLLSLLNIVIPGCISKTKYFIQRYFLKGSSEFVSHYYCPECETYLGKENTATNLETIFFCPSCKQNVSLDQCSSKGKYFLSSPIEDQLIYFMENTNLFDRIKAKKEKNVDLNVKGEIYTGECYRGEKVQSFLRESPYNFTMSYGSDGIHVYESSPYSVWPVFCTINELDFYEKSYFLSMSTLWHGDSKPQQNTFLQPFVEEAQHLYDHGFQWKDSNGILRRSKVMFLLCTADAPARAMLTNMTQFNGEYGCGICLNPGIRIRKG